MLIAFFTTPGILFSFLSFQSFLPDINNIFLGWYRTTYNVSILSTLLSLLFLNFAILFERLEKEKKKRERDSKFDENIHTVLF